MPLRGLNPHTMITTIQEAISHVESNWEHFNLLSCPKELYEGKTEAEAKLIKKAYYDRHCIELGI